MAWTGDQVPLVGIPPSFLKSLATQTLSGGAQVALGQVWQGSGRSFAAKKGQQLTGALADSAINIALNAVTGEEVGDVGGILLNTGTEILAPALTQYVTGPLANQINDSIAKSLEAAGPFGPVLSSAAGSLVSTALGGIAGGITGAIFGGGGETAAVSETATASTGNATNYKMFPGGNGQGEAPADYDNRAYTLNDIVFSIQPAYQGPRAFGDYSAFFDPKFQTKLPFGQLTNVNFGVDYPTFNAYKQTDMLGNFEPFGVGSGAT